VNRFPEGDMMFRLLSSGFASVAIASATSAIALPAAAAAKQNGCTPSVPSATVTQPMPVEVPGDKLTRLPANSSLVTQPAADLRSAEWKTGTNNTVLALVPAQDDQPRSPAGIIVSGPEDTRVTWLPAGANRAGNSWDLHTLERLYQLTLQKAPVQNFTFEIGAQKAPHTGSRTQAAILAAIARARNCVAHTEAVSTANAVSWEVVDVSPLRNPSRPLEVAVRASIAGRPVTDSQVTFARGLHLYCIAKTDRSGVAKCTLSELHEDDGADEDEAAPVVATFGGAVSPTKIQLPTTAVWSPPPTRTRRPDRSK
jgi:hypothetical protein